MADQAHQAGIMNLAGSVLGAGAGLYGTHLMSRGGGGGDGTPYTPMNRLSPVSPGSYYYR